MADDKLSDIEKLVVEIEQAGREWVDAKLKADQLEEDSKPFLSCLMNALEGTMSEAARERLAKGSKQYRDYVAGVAFARAEMLKKRVRYDALQSWFEAKRSNLALERAKIEKNIFHHGS